jgi:hypothetical protein
MKLSVFGFLSILSLASTAALASEPSAADGGSALPRMSIKEQVDACREKEAVELTARVSKAFNMDTYLKALAQIEKFMSPQELTELQSLNNQKSIADDLNLYSESKTILKARIELQTQIFERVFGKSPTSQSGEMDISSFFSSGQSVHISFDRMLSLRIENLGIPDPSSPGVKIIEPVFRVTPKEAITWLTLYRFSGHTHIAVYTYGEGVSKQFEQDYKTGGMSFDRFVSEYSKAACLDCRDAMARFSPGYGCQHYNSL